MQTAPESIVDRKLEEQIGAPTRMLAYMEHKLDLTGSLLVDLADIVRFLAPDKLTSEIEEKLDMMHTVLTEASINFQNINSPYESYKIPQAAKLKGIIRGVQNEFITEKLQDEGIIPKE